MIVEVQRWCKVAGAGAGAGTGDPSRYHLRTKFEMRLPSPPEFKTTSVSCESMMRQSFSPQNHNHLTPESDGFSLLCRIGKLRSLVRCFKKFPNSVELIAGRVLPRSISKGVVHWLAEN